MCTPKAPTPPSPTESASAQTGTNISTAAANQALGQVNQVGPNGSLTYGQTGTYTFRDPTSGISYELPKYTATTKLSDSQQKISDLNNQTGQNLAQLGVDQSGRISDVLSKPIDPNGLPAASDRSTIDTPTYGADLTAPTYTQQSGNAGLQTGYNTDFSADRQRVEDALFQRLNPQLDTEKMNIQRDLAARGVKEGSTAYDRAMQNFGKTENDARTSAILNAGQEQSRLAGLTQQEAEFGNTAKQQTFANAQGLTAANNALKTQGLNDQQTIQGRADSTADKSYAARMAGLDAQDASRNRQLGEDITLRNQPINEISALLSGSQVQAPTFGGSGGGGGGIPTTDLAGLFQQNYANQQGVYNQKVATNNANTGAAAGATASIISALIASDKRIKKDIEPVGEAKGRGGTHKLYGFRYKSESDDSPKHVGVMAQEVEKKAPEAVMKDHRGIRHVNYSMLFAGKAA